MIAGLSMLISFEFRAQRREVIAENAEDIWTQDLLEGGSEIVGQLLLSCPNYIPFHVISFTT